MRALILMTVFLASAVALAAPRSTERPELVLPNYAREVAAFDYPLRHRIAWHEHVVNAGWGGGRGGPERRGGFFDKHWVLIDYVDRSGDYPMHGYLKHRGIWFEVYGSNEYQETIHFHEEGARELLWDNGIARDIEGKRVVCPQFNRKSPRWAARQDWDAFIVCNNAPRWSAVINYDWLASPLLGCAISQDNIGGPVLRVGRGACGRFCDYCNLKFMHHLRVTGRLPEFRGQYKHIREYVRKDLMPLMRQLPPYAKWSPKNGALVARICDDPVMAEYQKFLYMSHLHNFVRYYRDMKIVAARTGREFDVHGNQGGGWIGFVPYQVALADFVDTVWFECSGLTEYDMLKYKWPNAWGAFRFQMGEAMTRGAKPLMIMTKFRKREPAIVELEMAEECAGGGILFVNQYTFEKEPECQSLLADYWQFRHEHRALFSPVGRERHAQVAMVYSVPTMMYRTFQAAPNTPPLNSLSGMARAFEEAHLPYDVIIFNHPEIHRDRLTLSDLKKYRLIVVPAVECMSDAQAALIGEYLKGGGRVATIGEVGVRDEDNKRRAQSVVQDWRAKGRVRDLLQGGALPFHRSDGNREKSLQAISQAGAAAKGILPTDPILKGPIPRMLWVKTWTHRGGFMGAHFVNYDVDYEAAKAKPTEPFPLSLRLPEGVRAEEAVFLEPTGRRVPLKFRTRGNRVELTVPSVSVYGVLVIGRRGLDRARSALMQGDAFMARARFACDGDWGGLQQEAAQLKATRGALNPNSSEGDARQYADGARALLVRVAAMQDERLFARLKGTAETEGAVLALDFGAAQDRGTWKAVGPDTRYDPALGYGWLGPASPDQTRPTPEEAHYARARGRKGPRPSAEALNAIGRGTMAAWPYKRRMSRLSLATNLQSPAQHRFRIDLPDGLYEIAVANSNFSWRMLSFKVSGMTSAGDDVRLLDTPLTLGDVAGRSFVTRVRRGHIALKFGGATGWGVCSVIVRPADRAEADPLARGALRRWRVSPRFANPDWYPVRQVRFSPEQRLAAPDTTGWQDITASGNGIGLVQLGTNKTAETGDVVYAATVIQARDESTASLHLGSSSSALVWLNGREVGYITNQKGMLRDELRREVKLRKGANSLVVKLAKFWERRWMFYANVTGP